MKNILTLLAATAAMSLATTAYAADQSAKVESTVDHKKNGGYETNVKSEELTAAGTAKTSERTVDVNVDSKGNVERTVKSEAVTDPKGLMNKKKDTSETQIEEKANGGYTQTTTRKHTDASGTDVTFKTVTDVDVDSSGNVSSTATTKRTVDPKGLMNKKTTSVKTKVVNGNVVEYDKEAN